MRNFKKKLVAIILTLVIVIIPTINLSAYTILSGYSAFNSSTINYRYYINGLINYSSQITTSATRWTAYSDVYTSENINSHKYHVISDNFGNTSWAGQCFYPRWWTIGPYFIDLNEYHIGYQTTYCTAVVMHEMGHMFGLDHSTSATSVMQITPYDVVYPNNDDVAGVNSIY